MIGPKLRNIDLTTPMDSTDDKFWRQLGHYKKGLKSSDPIEKYREFFLVLEDEGSGYTKDETSLRHAVNHPCITHCSHATRVNRILGKSFYDPFDPDHKIIINNYASNLSSRCNQLLVSKIK